MDILITIIGYAASVCMVLGYLPQAITTIRTRDTSGIAISTFSMMGLGSIFFVAQGILLDNKPLVITNVITSACSIIIFCIKIINEHNKNRNKNA